jgi:hypothetical protein
VSEEIERPPVDLPARADFAVIRSHGAVMHWHDRRWVWDGERKTWLTPEEASAR